MSNSTKNAKCCCNTPPQPSRVKKAAQSLSSTMLSVLIAFFPKCPLCWAVYMSMFSCLGVAKLPYMPWLLPVLCIFMGVHMLLLYKKALRVKNYLPFLVSLMGALIIIMTRALFPDEKWLAISGMAFIISGSLLNSFSLTGIRLTRPQIQ